MRGERRAGELSLFGRRKLDGIRSASRVSHPIEDEDDDEYENEGSPRTVNC